jgi:hypothetical protein
MGVESGRPGFQLQAEIRRNAARAPLCVFRLLVYTFRNSINVAC